MNPTITKEPKAKGMAVGRSGRSGTKTMTPESELLGNTLKVISNLQRHTNATGPRIEFLINVLLTQKCNFSCGHCCMNSGPKAPAGQMSIDDLLHIRDFGNEFEGLGIDVTYNLVGGEPTLYLEALESALRVLLPPGEANKKLEMTTNGWWLRNYESFTKVMQVLERPLLHDGLRVRISDSPFHTVFRKEEKETVTTPGGLLDFAQGENHITEEVLTRMLKNNPESCPECYEDLSVENWKAHTCPHCDANLQDALSYRTETDYDHNRFSRSCRALETAIAEDNIYVDVQNKHMISNTGRARDTQIAFLGGDCHWLNHRTMFTFKPGAMIHDFCCNGGPSEAGHAKQGIKLLVTRTNLLAQLDRMWPDRDLGGGNMERCQNCPKVSRDALAIGSEDSKIVDKAWAMLQKKLPGIRRKAEE